MKRWVKNLICIVVIVLMLSFIGTTMYVSRVSNYHPNSAFGVETNKDDIPEGGGWAGSSNKGDSEIPQNQNAQNTQNTQSSGGKVIAPNPNKTPNNPIVKFAIENKLIIYGFSSLIIALIASFLVISRFNKVNFKKSFDGGKNKIIFVVIAVFVLVLEAFIIWLI